MKWLLPAFLSVLIGASSASAQSGALPDEKPKVQASLVPEHGGVAPGGTLSIALKQVIRKNWHTYWVNPGDSGAATTVTWHLPPGWSAGPLQWPYPERLPVGPLMNFGYADQVALISDISAPPGARPGSTADIGADVNWLVCSDVCIPESTQLSLQVAITTSPLPSGAATARLFADTRAHLPRASLWTARYDAQDRRFALLLQNPAFTQLPPQRAAFFPYADGIIEAASPQRLETNSDGLVIEAAPGYKLRAADKRRDLREVGGVLVLADASGKETALDVRAEPGVVAAATPVNAPGGDLSLPLAVLFAFIGGLILNLMPCVFPVLSIKALTLARERDEPIQARASGLAYAFGVELSFIALAGALLALRSAGAFLGWGFQLQQPIFVACLALLMFAIGLNLSGLYELHFAPNVGARLAGRGGTIGSFFTGVLAVLVATPCTAPFMGAAAGYALSAAPLVSLAVFAALGAGFATPFLLLSLVPALRSALPRPGAWMATFRQLLAFPMYGAAVWLIWVLDQQAGPDGVLAALAGALLLSAALWLFGRTAHETRARPVQSLLALLGIVGGVLLAIGAGSSPAPAQNSGVVQTSGGLPYQPFTADRLASLQQAGRPVFVNATAAWCITCLVNERLALSGERLKQAFAAHNVAPLKADWTNQDASVTELLARHGRSGVPLYLYFPPHAATPVVLPQLLTESTVISALDKGS
jgi:thiol:disulfide interchange protein DsbD